MRFLVILTTAVATLMLVGCGSGEDGGAEDNASDTFMTDGKADVFGTLNTSPEAQAILQVVNTFSSDDLVTKVKLSRKVSDNILTYRAGIDKKAGTADDRVVLSLDALDTIPNVGKTVFVALLDYVKTAGLVDAFVPDCTQGEDCEDIEHRFVLSVPTHVALPFVTVGNIKPSSPFTIQNLGGKTGTQDLSIEVDGDFTVDGDLTPLGPLATRILKVDYTGSTTQPVIAQGLLHLSAEGRLLTIPLMAVVGDATLPNPEWKTVDGGLSATMGLPSAPFPHSSAAYTDNSVLVVVPSGLREGAAFDLVTHLHGHRCVIGTTIPSVFLVEQFLLSGRNAVFVVPQGPVNAASGNFGKLMYSGGFGRLVRDVVSVLYRDGLVTWPVVEQTVLTSHSGGYQATAAIIRNADLPISSVHLFDSLYGDEPTFRSFVQGGGLLRSNYTSHGGGTDVHNAGLLAQFRNDGITVGTSNDDASLFADPVTIVYSAFSHFESLWAERSFARWLRQSDLPPNRLDPPELRSVTSDGDKASVSWMVERADGGTKVLVEGSADGVTWAELGQGDASPLVVAAKAFVRIRRIDAAGDLSAPSDVYPGSGDGWLVVDGFDRVLDGAYHAATHDFAASLCKALGEPCSGVSNEAVALGDIDLTKYPQVMWMLGDESRLDFTFDAAERSAISTYLAAGGRLVVSGSEVGFSTDAAWFQGTLHAKYVSDSANTSNVDEYTFGVAYPVKYPDVLSGTTVIWRYATGGAAAVGWDSRVVVVGFPLETLAQDDLPGALSVLKTFLGP